MASYVFMKVPQLKEELRKRGATTRGRKNDLIERLEHYDRNDNFGSNTTVFLDPSIPGWPEGGFKQVTPGHKNTLPQLTKTAIVNYFQNKQDADNLPCANIKAVEKGEKLVEAKRLAACSFVETDDAHFFTGFVRAAMKKRVSYNFKLRLHKFEPVRVENSHCECPAGRGPTGTCKHVAAALVILANFVSTGVLGIPGTCTDELQQFHRPPKVYAGSPVKAVNLSIKSKSRELDLDDPRPERFRNMPGFNDRVRNSVINYVAASGDDLVMRYLYPKADLQIAAKDHLYESNSFLEHWVDHANSVTKQKADEIEAGTRQQSKCYMWQKERQWRLTASNFGRICKITKRCNRYKLCESMLNPVILKAPAIVHGRSYETTAIHILEERENVTVEACGLYVHPDHPYLGATPDGWIDEDTIVEVKCPYAGREEMIAPGKHFPFLRRSGDDLMLKEHHAYYFQVQGQMFLAQAKVCFFAIYTFKDFKYFKVELDEEYCTQSLVPKLKLFYEKVYRKHIASSF